MSNAVQSQGPFSFSASPAALLVTVWRHKKLQWDRARTAELNQPKGYYVLHGWKIVRSSHCLEIGWTAVGRWWAIVLCINYFAYINIYMCNYYFYHYCYLLSLFRFYFISTHDFFSLSRTLWVLLSDFLPYITDRWEASTSYCVVLSYLTS